MTEHDLAGDTAGPGSVGGHTLVLLRHARAEPAGELGDHARPLAAPGRRQASRIGARIAERLEAPQLVLVSDALRAHETYRLLAAAHGGLPEAKRLAELYDAGPRDVIALLAELDDALDRVLVVGHEPTMSGLATVLDMERNAGPADLGLGMGTAEAAVLDVPGSWAGLDRSVGRLREVLRPSEG